MSSEAVGTEKLLAAESGEPGEGGEESAEGGKVRTGTIVSSFANLAGTIMGSSSLAMPFAAASAGLGLFPVLILVVGVLAENSALLLVRCAHLSGKETYSEIGRAAAGRWGELGVVVGVLVQQLGAAIAFQKIQGDVLAPVVSRLPASSAFSRPWPWQLLLAALVILPLCLLPRINSLRFSSLGALALVLVFSVVVVVDGFGVAADPVLRQEAERSRGRADGAPRSFVDALLALPILAFAFTCHQNVPAVLRELQSPTLERFSVVSKLSFVSCGLIYVLSGMLGYEAFRAATDTDVIAAYTQLQTHARDHLVVPAAFVRVCMVGIGVALTLSYPIIAYELRHSIEEVVDLVSVGHIVQHPPGHVQNWTRHIAVVAAMVVATTTLALTVPSIGTVFGFAGATSAPFIVYILPSIFFLRLDTGASAENALTRKLAYAELAIGLVLVPVCLAAEIVKLADPNT